MCNSVTLPLAVSTMHCAYSGYITIGGLVRTYGYETRQEWDTRFLSGVQVPHPIAKAQSRNALDSHCD